MVLELFTPGIGPMLAAAGAEFVIFDMEHGRCDLSLAAEMIASCRGSSIVPIVRVPDSRHAPLSRVLDLGARGVMIPRVGTRAEIEDCIEQLKYPPRGRRGVALGMAHDLYQPGPRRSSSRQTTTRLDHRDSRNGGGIRRISMSIVSTPGLDVAWMGHYDLTTSMGIPRQFDHPRFLDGDGRTRIRVHACTGSLPGFLPATPPTPFTGSERDSGQSVSAATLGFSSTATRSFRSRGPRCNGQTSRLKGTAQREVYRKSVQHRDVPGSRPRSLLDDAGANARR